MTTVVLLAGFRSAGTVRRPGVPWVYLGKNVFERDQIGRLLGESGRVFTGEMFSAHALRLRGPYLDYLAELGRERKDSLEWWVGSLAGRHTYVTDFFFLLCYIAIFDELIRSPLSTDRIVVVEDPWLFAQLRRDFAASARFVGSPGLGLRRLRVALRALLGRLWWGAVLLRSWLVTRLRGAASAPERAGADAVALYSVPQRRCFEEPGAWKDHYTGGLFELLSRSGVPVCRVAPPEAVGFEKEVCGRRETAFPLMRMLTPFDILRENLRFGPWALRREDRHRIAGYRVDVLAQMEAWRDWFSPTIARWRLFYIGLCRFFKARMCGRIVFPYENISPDRVICLAAWDCGGVGTVGYQHNIVSRFAMPFFLGRGEAESMPIPDRIITSGAYNLEMLASGGTPAERMVIGGAWRYLYAFEEEGTRDESFSERVLVCLPDDDKQSNALLGALTRAFGSGGAHPPLHVKFHPTTPEHRRAFWSRSPLFSFMEGDLKDWIRRHRPACILFVGSTVGVEFALQGFRVLQYLPETFIGHDSTDALPRGFYSSCTDRDIRDKLLECLADRQPPRLDPEEVERQAARIWGGIDEELWIESLRPPSARRHP